MHRDAQAAGAGAKLTAEPGILIVSIDQQVIHPWKLAGEHLKEQLVAPPHLLVHQAIGRAVAVSSMGVVRRTEVKERSQPSLLAERNPVPQFSAPLLTRLGPRLAAQRHDLRILLVLFGAKAVVINKGINYGRGVI
jgi:hypothetical protein